MVPSFIRVATPLSGEPRRSACRPPFLPGDVRGLSGRPINHRTESALVFSRHSPMIMPTDPPAPSSPIHRLALDGSPPLMHDEPNPGGTAPSSVACPPVLALLNPKSGTCRVEDVRRELTAQFRDVPIRLHEIDADDDMDAILSEALAAGCSQVVAGGGDGTVSAVAGMVGTPRVNVRHSARHPTQHPGRASRKNYI